MNARARGKDPGQALGGSQGLEPGSSIVIPGHSEPTIYDVARVAGVAPSTVSRALSKPGRVSYKTAEQVRRVAEQLGYRAGRIERAVSERGTGMLGITVADIANPVFFGMIRGAERAASDRGFTMLVVETQESEEVERAALDRLKKAHPTTPKELQCCDLKTPRPASGRA